MTHALGRKVNHDPRSLDYPASYAGTHRPVTHRTYGPVLDQGNLHAQGIRAPGGEDALGSCVLNAAAHALNTAGSHRKGQRLMREQDAVDWYGPTTASDPFSGTYPPDDTGTDANSAAKYLRNQGRITSWSHAFGLEQLLGALQLKPVMLGISWHQSMFRPDKDGFVHPDGNVVGGHETLIRGDDADHSVLVRNSWGSSWGLRGHYRLTYSDLAALLADGGDAVVLNV
ncbi:hypothetical protein [Terrabacter terrigena]|uniref:Uncharacterized protein n=1 Tax=Terrabacter terrigena TaxID=574718 RepID=A0ABW3N113_9MICO